MTVSHFLWPHKKNLNWGFVLRMCLLSVLIFDFDDINFHITCFLSNQFQPSSILVKNFLEGPVPYQSRDWFRKNESTVGWVVRIFKTHQPNNTLAHGHEINSRPMTSCLFTFFRNQIIWNIETFTYAWGYMICALCTDPFWNM